MNQMLNPLQFSVEIQQAGQKPRIIASDVSLGVARTICRETVQDCVWAAVQRVYGPPASESRRNYLVWLWNERRRVWCSVTIPMTYADAHRWAKDWGNGWMDGIALVWPAWTSEPPQLLKACRRNVSWAQGRILNPTESIPTLPKPEFRHR